MLKYFLSILMIFSPLLVCSQNANGEVDTLAKKPRPVFFIRAGFDLASVGRQLLEQEVQQYEGSLDTEVYRNWFFNIEGGIASVEARQDDYQYLSQGYFFRLGVDYNLLKRLTPDEHDLFILGVRYARANQRFELPMFEIGNPYWGNYQGSIGSIEHQLQWMELVGGMKTEVFKNFFLGWSVRVKVRLNSFDSSDFNPYYVSGFGQGKRRAPLALNYSIFYRLAP